MSCFNAANAANAALSIEIMSGKDNHSADIDTPRQMERFAKLHPTMILFTMRTEFNDVVEKLREQYLPETPMAIVSYAGYKERETVIKVTVGHHPRQDRGWKKDGALSGLCGRFSHLPTL